ncbi:hypothetical protein CRG98_033108, partial [Punica granatum]
CLNSADWLEGALGRRVEPGVWRPGRIARKLGSARGSWAAGSVGPQEALGYRGLWASDGLGRMGWTRAFRVEF